MMKYLQAYPQHLQDQVSELIATDRLGQVLRQRYQGAGHSVRTDRALYDYSPCGTRSSTRHSRS